MITFRRRYIKTKLFFPRYSKFISNPMKHHKFIKFKLFDQGYSKLFERLVDQDRDHKYNEFDRLEQLRTHR